MAAVVDILNFVCEQATIKRPRGRLCAGALTRDVFPAPITACGECNFVFSNKRGADLRAVAASVNAVALFCAESAPFGGILVVTPNPKLLYAKVLQRFFSERDAVLRAPVIGENCTLHAAVTLYPNTVIGNDVEIYAGAVIGCPGFGFIRDDDEQLVKFMQLGRVVVENGVTIGANTVICRGALSDTIIREGTKIDGSVFVAHNVEIGKHSAVVAHAEISGSVKIGDYCYLAPGCCVINGVSIGDGATVGMGAVVLKDVPPNAVVVGNPARIVRYDRLCCRG